jgi:hypothetical protein
MLRRVQLHNPRRYLIIFCEHIIAVPSPRGEAHEALEGGGENGVFFSFFSFLFMGWFVGWFGLD